MMFKKTIFSLVISIIWCANNVGSEPQISDSFSRELSNNWGSADGTPNRSWSILSGNGDFYVTNDSGIIEVEDNSTRIITVNRAYQNIALSTTVSFSNVPNEALEAGLIVRNHPVNRGNYYYFKLYQAPGSNEILLSLYKVIGGSIVAHIGNSVSLRSQLVNDKKYHLRVQAYGSYPTQLKAKFWAADQLEPSLWTLERQDNDNNLQEAGFAGFRAELKPSFQEAATVLVDSYSLYELPEDYAPETNTQPALSLLMTTIEAVHQINNNNPNIDIDLSTLSSQARYVVVESSCGYYSSDVLAARTYIEFTDQDDQSILNMLTCYVLNGSIGSSQVIPIPANTKSIHLNAYTHNVGATENGVPIGNSARIEVNIYGD